jgi:hypothetical protein
VEGSNFCAAFAAAQSGRAGHCRYIIEVKHRKCVKIKKLPIISVQVGEEALPRKVGEAILTYNVEPIGTSEDVSS